MSGYNLPDGVDEGDPRAPWNEEPERCCGTCSRWILFEGCRRTGVCERERAMETNIWNTCDFWEEA